MLMPKSKPNRDYLTLNVALAFAQITLLGK